MMTARWTHAVLALALVFAGIAGVQGTRLDRVNQAFQADAVACSAGAAKRAKSSWRVEPCSADHVQLFTPPGAPAIVARTRGVEVVTTLPPPSPRIEASGLAARARAPPA